MQIDEKINSLQNLKNRKISYEEIARSLDMSGSALRNWVYRKRELKEFEIAKIDNYFNVTQQNKTDEDCIIIDYIHLNPSCGYGTAILDEPEVTPIKYSLRP